MYVLPKCSLPLPFPPSLSLSLSLSLSPKHYMYVQRSRSNCIMITALCVFPSLPHSRLALRSSVSCAPTWPSTNRLKSQYVSTSSNLSLMYMYMYMYFSLVDDTVCSRVCSLFSTCAYCLAHVHVLSLSLSLSCTYMYFILSL